MTAPLFSSGKVMIDDGPRSIERATKTVYQGSGRSSLPTYS